MNLRQLLSGKALLILLLGIAAAAGVWYFLVTPSGEDLSVAEQDLTRVLARTEALRREFAGLQAGDSNETEAAYVLAKELDDILQPGASSHHQRFFLVYMPQLAIMSGLSTEPASIPGPQIEGNLGYLSYTYSLNGTLPQTLAFLEQVRQLPLLSTVEEFSTNLEGTEGGREVWRSTLTLRVWWTELQPLADFQPADLSEYLARVGVSQPPTTTTTTTPSPDTSVPAPPAPGSETEGPGDEGLEEVTVDDGSVDEGSSDEVTVDDVSVDDSAPSDG